MENEEEHHAADTEKNDDHGQSDKNGGCPEGRGGDRVEIRQLSLADDILPVLHHPACLPQSEVSGSAALLGVSQPVWLDEDHHDDDGKADGEDPPQDSDGFRVLHVVGVLQARLGGILVFGIDRHGC